MSSSSFTVARSTSRPGISFCGWARSTTARSSGMCVVAPISKARCSASKPHTRIAPRAIGRHRSTRATRRQPPPQNIICWTNATPTLTPTLDGLRFFFDVDRAGGSFIVRGMKSSRPTIVAAFDDTGRPIKRLLQQRLSWDVLPKHAVDLDIEWEISASVVLRSRLVVLYKKDKRNRNMFIYLHNNLGRIGRAHV